MSLASSERLKDDIVLGSNSTQQSIFRLIYERSKTIKDIASSLGFKEKTIENNVPKLRELVSNSPDFEFIKNYNRFNEPVYAVVKKRKLVLDLQSKLFTWTRAIDVPYLVINLPPPPQGFDKWVIIPVGDVHFGADSCDVDSLLDWLKYIEDTPNVLAILNGDLIENADKQSPGASVFHQLIPPQEQKERFTELLVPISHKILYSVKGNHGDRSVKRCFLSPERDISHLLNVEFFDGACYADIISEDFKWEIMSIHGITSASTPGGRLNAIYRKNQFHSAQIFTMGHVHDLQANSDTEIVRDPINLTLRLRKRYYVICGTTQKYWNSYAEEWVLPPNRVGMPKIELYCTGSRRPGDYHVIT